jgi:hypothetical protein
MVDPSSSTLTLAHRFEQALAALVPFFLNDPDGDTAAAREAAKARLDCYMAATPKELQLATELVAYGWASMACLGAASSVKNASIDEMMDWQDAAIALQRLCTKISKALEMRRKERTKNPKAMTVENTRWDEGAFQLGINRALEKVMLARTKIEAFKAAMAPAASKPVPVAVVPKIKFPSLSAQQMTPSVLARRARH